MGLVQKWKELRENRSQRRFEKATKIIRNPKAIREDRWAALDYLANLDHVNLAVTGLLDRFDYSLEHGINDTREKELAMKGIVRFGKEALPFVRQKISTTTRIAWPIKILKEIANEDEVALTLKSSLNYNDVSFDQSAVDKNYDILCYLRDYKLGEDWKRVTHFLNDPDERVRFACVETLIEQDTPGLSEILERFVSDLSAENRRIRQAVILAFVRNGWRLQNPSIFPEGQIEPGVLVSPQGQIEIRTN